MRKHILFLLVVFLILGVSLAKAQDVLVSSSIILVKNFQIWTVDAAGNQKQLTQNGANMSPAPSPTENKIAYICSDTEEDICIMDGIGENKIHLKIYSFGSPNQIAWSPSGNKLLVRVHINAEDILIVYDVNSHTAKAINSPRREKRQAGMGVWSPDSTQIAYACVPFQEIPIIGNFSFLDSDVKKSDICTWNRGTVSVIDTSGADILPYWVGETLHWVKAGQYAEVWQLLGIPTKVRDLGREIIPEWYDRVVENRMGIQVFPIVSPFGGDDALLLLGDPKGDEVITFINGGAVQPSLAPDGKWLLFVSKSNVSRVPSTVFVAATNGAVLVPLTSSEETWSSGSISPRWFEWGYEEPIPASSLIPT